MITWTQIAIIVTITVIVIIALLVVAGLVGYNYGLRYLRESQQYRAYKRVEPIITKVNSMSDDQIDKISDVVESFMTFSDTPEEATVEEIEIF